MSHEQPATFPIDDGEEVLNLVPKPKEEVTEIPPIEITEEDVEAQRRASDPWNQANTDVAAEGARVWQEGDELTLQPKEEDLDGGAKAA